MIFYWIGIIFHRLERPTSFVASHLRGGQAVAYFDNKELWNTRTTLPHFPSSRTITMKKSGGNIETTISVNAQYNYPISALPSEDIMLHTTTLFRPRRVSGMRAVFAHRSSITVLTKVQKTKSTWTRGVVHGACLQVMSQRHGAFDRPWWLQKPRMDIRWIQKKLRRLLR